MVENLACLKLLFLYINVINIYKTELFYEMERKTRYGQTPMIQINVQNKKSKIDLIQLSLLLTGK